MSAFVGVLLGNRKLEDCEPYFRSTDSVARKEKYFAGEILVIKSTTLSDAQYLSDRLNSGLFGAKAFQDETELKTWLEEWK